MRRVSGLEGGARRVWYVRRDKPNTPDKPGRFCQLGAQQREMHEIDGGKLYGQLLVGVVDYLSPPLVQVGVEFFPSRLLPRNSFGVDRTK